MHSLKELTKKIKISIEPHSNSIKEEDLPVPIQQLINSNNAKLDVDIRTIMQISWIVRIKKKFNSKSQQKDEQIYTPFDRLYQHLKKVDNIDHFLQSTSLISEFLMKK